MDLTWDFSTQDADKTLKLIPVNFLWVLPLIPCGTCAAASKVIQGLSCWQQRALNHACHHRTALVPTSKDWGTEIEAQP